MNFTDDYGNCSENAVYYNGTCQEVECGVPPVTLMFQVTVYTMYSLIFIIALLGNGIVCYIVYSSARMKTVTNLFIVNLAVGDILMTLFCVPFSFLPTLILQVTPILQVYTILFSAVDNLCVG